MLCDKNCLNSMLEYQIRNKKGGNLLVVEVGPPVLSQVIMVDISNLKNIYINLGI